MLPPPLDAAGRVIPHDHAEIGDGDGVIRRISAEFLVPSADPGTRRISSMAFRPSTGGGMSVDLEALIVDGGLDARSFVTTRRFVGSVRFTTGALRAEDLLIGFDPLPENPFHDEVWGSFTKSRQRRLQSLVRWYVEIEGVTLSP